MIQIRFTAQGANSTLGGFAPGDIARVAPDFARHLVEVARVAEYVAAEPITEKATRTRAPKRAGK